MSPVTTKMPARLGGERKGVINLQDRKTVSQVDVDSRNTAHDYRRRVPENENTSVEGEGDKNLNVVNSSRKRDMQRQAAKLALTAQLIARFVIMRSRRKPSGIYPQYTVKPATRVPARLGPKHTVRCMARPGFRIPVRPNQFARLAAKSAVRPHFQPKQSAKSLAADPLLWNFGRGRSWGRKPWQWRGRRIHDWHQFQNDAAHLKSPVSKTRNAIHRQHHSHDKSRIPNRMPRPPILSHKLRHLAQPPAIQARSLHGLQPSGIHGLNHPHPPHFPGPNFHMKAPRPASFKDLNLPHPPPQMPHISGKSLPRMYSPGMPDTQLTLDKIRNLMHDGKIPPINFNCNSNNHILHLVHQHSARGRRRKRSVDRRWSGSSSSELEEDSDDQSMSVESKSIVPFLKRVEAKDVHSLYRMRPPAGAPPHVRPVIHHHGPRIILVCISNTYLTTLIRQHRGSSSNESG